MTEHTQTISDDVVDAEFSRFLEAMDLKEKTESKRLTAEDLKELESIVDTVKGAMRKGTLVIDEAGQPRYTPQVGDRTPLVFAEPEGADLMAMDQAKKDHNVAKQNNLLGAVTHTGAKRFANMKNRDYVVCRSIIQLFLA